MGKVREGPGAKSVLGGGGPTELSSVRGGTLEELVFGCDISMCSEP